MNKAENKTMDYESKKLLHEFYSKETKSIEEERLYQRHCFDSWILKLCAGSFAVSFAFVEKIINLTAAQWKLALLFSWLSFGLCLIVSVSGFLISEKVLLKQFHNEWKKYSDKINGIRDKIYTNRFYTTVSQLIDYLSVSLFFSGVLCQIIFIFKNLRK